MKRAISFLLVLVFCLALTVPVFATNDDDFVISPGEGGFACG